MSFKWLWKNTGSRSSSSINSSSSSLLSSAIIISLRQLLLLLLLTTILLATQSPSNVLFVHGFTRSSTNHRYHALVMDPPATTSTPKSPVFSYSMGSSSSSSLLVRRLFNNNNNNDDDDDNDNNNNNNDTLLYVLSRRFEKADKVAMSNDAILVSCYVLARFFVYDVTTTGSKLVPGWNVQDVIWLTGTFSSATVLVTYYSIAGLLSRSFEVVVEQEEQEQDCDDDDVNNNNKKKNKNILSLSTSSDVIKALVNVALCCPVWLATEHLLGFGPSDVGGGTQSIAVSTGFVGLGSFMALAKTLLSSSSSRRN